MSEKTPLPHRSARGSHFALVPGTTRSSAKKHKGDRFALGPILRQLFLGRNSYATPVEELPTEEKFFALVQPYYFCPLCHHQFSSTQTRESFRENITYPQAKYFRTLTARRSSGPDESTFGYYASFFLEIRKLSRGAFGAVYVCQHVLNNVPLGIFAVKKIPVGDDTGYLSKVLKEVRILEDMKKHPNVIEYNHSWIDRAKTVDFGPVTRCLFILMEFATEGSLDQYLGRHGYALSNMLVWYFFLSAVAGVNHLHCNDILHCDLKPQNLLLTSGIDGVLPRLMVSDFGASCVESAMAGASDARGCTGTEEYMAPELFDATTRNLTHTYRYTRGSDVWSLGVILHFLMTGGDLSKWDQVTGTVRLHSAVHNRPAEMISLLRELLAVSPGMRPSCQDILNSAVVQNLRQEVMNNSSSFREDFTGSPQFVFTAPEGSDSSENAQNSLPSPSLKPQIVYPDKQTMSAERRCEDPKVNVALMIDSGKHLLGILWKALLRIAFVEIRVPVIVVGLLLFYLYLLISAKR